MPIYSAPQREYRFVVEEFLRLERYAEIAPYDAYSPELFEAFLVGAARICEGVALPLNQSGDAEGCRFDAGRVTTPSGFREAYRRFAEGGWIGLAFEPTYGGQGLPRVMAEAFNEMLASANLAFSGYIELSEAVFSAINAHGDEAQRRVYLPRLADGSWTGAMHLTEAHAGSDLRLVRTRAAPQADGSFRITGDKVFITNAEHDLAENIVHLVLARTPDAPEGSGGLSLFIVPKFLVNGDGALGTRNGVQLLSIEHKMGLRAAPTGVVHYEAAVGHLLGRLHGGLKAMFTMVNDARLGVALQGLAQAEVARQNALAYSRQRRQGRALEMDRGAAPVPLLAHPDVRKMLLTMCAFTEAARGLGLWLALQIDLASIHPDAGERRRAEALIALLTPVVKAHFSDWGFEVANLGLQCFGGYGYVRETGVEQFVRDVRITQIYEGTNGIQALDLVRRKLADEEGGGWREFTILVSQSIDAGGGLEELGPTVAAMRASLGHLDEATQWMQQRTVSGDAIGAAAGATEYLRLFGLVALGWVWLDFARIAAERVAAKDDDVAFYRRKLRIAEFFARRVLPETEVLSRLARLGASEVMALAEDAL
jgi:alkylation response protein AidB-like acyl-CoA dehydrogenase